MFRALLYLRLTSLANRMLARLKRLREPKYLFGALAGGTYLWLVFFRRTPGSSPDLVPLFAGLGAAFLLFIVVLSWAIPDTQPGLGFTEAEIAFLFPAPMSRRTLVNFKLLGSQFTILFTSLFFALVFNRWRSIGGNAFTHALGWWVILSTLNLHKIAAGLTLNRLIEGGVSTTLRRVVVLGIIGAAIVGAVWWIGRNAAAPTEEDVMGLQATANYLTTIFNDGPLGWVLWPFRTVLAPFFAPTVREFLLTLGPAFAIMAVHYYWVMRLSEVSFEEASIAAAEKHANILAQARAGAYRIGATQAKARRGPFRLADTGWAPLAFLWKNLLSTRPYFSLRTFGVLAAVILVASRWFHGNEYNDLARHFAMILSGAAIFYSMLLGPQLARQDLRSDLTRADILKTYPIRGSQLVLGELLTPVAILTGIIWLGLLLGALALAAEVRSPKFIATTGPFIFAAIAAAVTPLLVALQLLVVNAATVIFPGWFQASRNIGGGIEVMGQRLIFFFGNALVMMGALLPSLAGGFAALIGVYGIFVAGEFFGGSKAEFGTFSGLIAALIVVFGILVAEVWVGIRWLGARFEKFDLSAEIRPS